MSDELKTIKVKPETHQKVIEYISKRQLETHKKMTIDKALQEALELEKKTIDIPQEMGVSLEKVIKKTFGRHTSLEQGVTRILQEHIQKEKQKRKKPRGGKP